MLLWCCFASLCMKWSFISVSKWFRRSNSTYVSAIRWRPIKMHHKYLLNRKVNVLECWWCKRGLAKGPPWQNSFMGQVDKKVLCRNKGRID
jgi:hypothetical protein